MESHSRCVALHACGASHCLECGVSDCLETVWCV